MLKNITLSADERLIQQARDKASNERKTLNSVFRGWLNRYVGGYSISLNYKASGESALKLAMMRMIDEQYLKCP